MSDCSRAEVSIALLHYPVYNKNREIVTTAVTNLDLHDIARAAKTYGLRRYYVVTPVPEQQNLALRIVRHWQDGWGATYNSKRKAALDIVRVVESLDAAIADIKAESGQEPCMVATGAAGTPGAVGYGDLAEKMAEGRNPYILLFGTGWGLAEEISQRVDHVLAPVKGAGDYNHLSVRSAVSIILDRLFGR